MLRQRQQMHHEPYMDVAPLIAPKLHVLQVEGQVAYLIHRRDIGDPMPFLRAVQAYLWRMLRHVAVRAHWWEPWTVGQEVNVLVVEVLGEREEGM